MKIKITRSWLPWGKPKISIDASEMNISAYDVWHIKGADVDKLIPPLKKWTGELKKGQHIITPNI